MINYNKWLFINLSYLICNCSDIVENATTRSQTLFGNALA